MSVRDWWTTHPSSGTSVHVAPYGRVALAEQDASDARIRVAVMQEAAVRLKIIAHRAVTEGGASGDEARRELRDGLAWLAKGAPAQVSDDELEPVATQQTGEPR